MTHRRTRHPLLYLFLALALALPLAACGGDEGEPQAGSSPSASTDGFPVTLDAANGKVTLDERPVRIVSLSPTATEMLFAIGAGDQVIAAEENSNYPEEAPDTDLSGFEPNVEAIAAYEPDLVIASNEPGDLEDSITALDIPFLLQPAAATLDDTYTEIEELGSATGHSDEALQVVDSMLRDIAEIRSTLPQFDEPPTYFHELDDTYFTATSKTFIGLVYASLGLSNIADKADKDGTGYPQLSAEYIVKADPDLIFLADTKCCGQSAATVAKRPGWEQITAVKNGGVVELDDDIASRWGPRVVDYLRIVAEAVAGLES
ncbi:MAG: cobalamin transport system substrate-binding protein [Actinomycetota bacterium]|jgi:iron complex transport system substrate-binding protein|nr:cobalamin transport system substrate-binding protein [Actinomycetota bacterium]